MEQADAPADAVWRYRDDVWRLASQLCGHREDAEDVTHSALLKAAQHLDGPPGRCCTGRYRSFGSAWPVRRAGSGAHRRAGCHGA
ncbi:MAG: RNA polymerase sigma factor [Micromonosporaceae bacterium]